MVAASIKVPALGVDESFIKGLEDLVLKQETKVILFRH